LVLFLKELQELGDLANNFPPTPELERITYYPNYPVGPRGNLVSHPPKKIEKIDHNQRSQ
jgi:hypothetical protein